MSASGLIEYSLLIAALRVAESSKSLAVQRATSSVVVVAVVKVGHVGVRVDDLGVIVRV